MLHLLPHNPTSLFRKTWASLPTPGAVGIPGQTQQHMQVHLTILSRRPHYRTLRYRNTSHLAPLEYLEVIGIPDSHYPPSVTGIPTAMLGMQHGGVNTPPGVARIPDLLQSQKSYLPFNGVTASSAATARPGQLKTSRDMKIQQSDTTTPPGVVGIPRQLFKNNGTPQ